MARSKGKNRRRKPHGKSSKRRQKLRLEFPPESLDVLLEAVQTDPEDILARLELGEFYLRNDLEDKILDALANLEERYPFSDKFMRGYYNRLLAFGHAHRRQFIEAEKAARRGLEEYPDSLDFYFVLSYVHMSLKELDQTIAEAEHFVSIWNRIKQGQLPPPDFTFTGRHITQLYNILATAYRDNGKVSEARSYYEKSIDADPGNHLPYVNCANLLKQYGELDRAEEFVQRGLSECRQVHELRMLARSHDHKATVSACMIVKDEEELLPGCLESIRDWVDEIIVVDTGSTDRTVEIAKSYGARIFHQPWEGNFSKHRNFSTAQSVCDWIFIIDADERIYQEDISLIKKVLNQDDYKIISINVFNVSGENEEHVTFLPSIRFFKGELGLKYEGIVHNIIHPPADQPIMRAGIRLKHYGYGLSPEKMKAKMARSKALLEKQIAENPDNAFALFNLAQLLRGQGVEDHPENAVKIKEAAGRALELTNPDVASERHIHIMTHHQLCWIHFVLGEYDKAEKYCLDVLQLKPDYLDALLVLGHIYLRQEILDKAEQYYRKYLEAQAKYSESCETDNIIILHLRSLPSAYYGLGLVAEYTGKPQRAREYYRKTFDLSPNYMDVCIRLGRLYLSDHDYIGADRCFLKQLELNENSHEALLGLADLRFLQEDFGEADRYYHRSLQVNATDAMTLTKYGHFLLETGKDSRGVEMLNRAAKSIDSSGKAKRYLADIYFRKGCFEEAADVCRQLLKAEEKDGEILNDLGNCYYKSGRWDEAIKYYLQALESPTVPPVAYRNLGLVRARLGELDEAILAFEKYLELEPNQHDVQYLVGDLHSKMSRYDLAIPYYERCLQACPHDALVLYHLSECYLHMGHRDSAILGYQRVLQMDRNFKPAQKRLSELAEPAGTA
jgi:tetratricopeptide (TPR) repeat protein